jgi:hypothetical protein
MPINDPEAIRFVNEVLRPLCEEARGLNIRLGALRTLWYGGLDAKFSKSEELVEDGRESEGVSRLTANDVTNAVAQILKTAPGESGAWNEEIIQKPCVRQLP